MFHALKLSECTLVFTSEQILPLGRNGTQQVRATLFDLLESGCSSFQIQAKITIDQSHCTPIFPNFFCIGHLKLRLLAVGGEEETRMVRG